MYQLLSSIEYKENSQIKNILLEVLYLCGNKSFNNAVIKSCENITQLEDNGKDVYLFGIGYKIAKKQANSTKET